MEFIDRLVGWMKENKIKQAEISDKANMSRSYISKVVNGSKPPSENLINVLAKMSGKSVHWWLFGEDEYKGLASLNALIDTFIKSGEIKEDGTYDCDIEMILKTMLDKEIRDKLKEAQR
ncbi:helix-turn-helix domain-containing protein [Clostridium weizhouense]|uniref:Helix-turn-helix domain-containing protein n=1 Tax=Clostridium weizhouense TaxID=2859781 RepID=A0ABS7AK82_9CLOT|nr:helix-turn-helix transcriptional regulator [Clostridium weizhouense]MBW6409027.1 helix-turn-helix domain-containing protein [Clostridium weizhouense]